MAYHCQTPQYACSVGMSSAEVSERSEDLGAQGYQLDLMVTYADATSSRYAAIWLHRLKSAVLKVSTGLSAISYQSTFDKLNVEGYHLKNVSAVGYNGILLYTGLWEDGAWKGFTARHEMSATEYQSEFEKLSNEGYRIVWVSGSSTGSASSYSGIWSSFADSDRHARHNLAIEDYQAVFDEMNKNGYRPEVFNAHTVGTKTYVAAIFIKAGGTAWVSRSGMTECELQNELERRAWFDYRPISIGGYSYKGANRFAGIWVKNSRSMIAQGQTASGLDVLDVGLQNLMTANGITAGSLAVTRNGALVLARGYGNITKDEEPAPPTALFRIASVSKALTGTGIIKLIENGTLNSLDKLDKMVDLIGWKDTVMDVRVKDVTVDDLLHHAGGWDRSPDPMFEDQTIASDLNIDLPITQESIFRWVMTKQTLDNPPGKVYAYSNFGYTVLGMIIERVTGMSYEDFMTESILLPLGIRRMRIARTLFQDRMPGEVTYHPMHAGLYPNVMVKGAPSEVMQMYGFYNFANMAAHGGWLASAVDLVKFASAFDNPKACPILSQNSVKTLLTRDHKASPKSAGNYDACGWSVRPGNPTETYKTGGFNGTDAIMCRRTDGTNTVNFAVILNRADTEILTLPCDSDPPQSGDTTPFSWALSNLVRGWMNQVTSWPSVDLWDQYF